MKPLNPELLSDAVTYAGEWMGYQQRTRRLPGVAVAVAHQGRLLLERAYGVADLAQGTPLRTDHRFRIASHSKMFTATAAFVLQERGALALDDRVGRWLDWTPGAEGELGRVTIRQLLSHSAGVIRDGVDTGFWSLEHAFPDEAEFRRLLEKASVVYAPNVLFKYSNFGFTLAGLAIAAAAGKPYNDVVRELVVAPLGLKDTGPEPGPDDDELLSRGHSSDEYGRERRVLPHTDTRVMSPATGFYSTVSDLTRFAQAHFLGNTALLTDESKREMQHEQWRVEGQERGYAHGLITYDFGGRRLVGHTGGFPGFITSTMFDPEQQLVITVLTNASAGAASEMSAGIMRLIGRAQEAGAGGASLRHFAGRFYSPDGALDVVRFGDQLTAVDPQGANPLGETIRLEPDGDAALKIEEAPGFASPGERIEYEFAPDGAASAIRWAGSRMVASEAEAEATLRAIPTTGWIGR